MSDEQMKRAEEFATRRMAEIDAGDKSAIVEGQIGPASEPDAKAGALPVPTIREALELMVQEFGKDAAKNGLGPARLMFALSQSERALAAEAKAVVWQGSEGTREQCEQLLHAIASDEIWEEIANKYFDVRAAIRRHYAARAGAAEQAADHIRCELSTGGINPKCCELCKAVSEAAMPQQSPPDEAKLRELSENAGKRWGAEIAARNEAGELEE